MARKKVRRAQCPVCHRVFDRTAIDTHLATIHPMEVEQQRLKLLAALGKSAKPKPGMGLPFKNDSASAPPRRGPPPRNIPKCAHCDGIAIPGDNVCYLHVGE
jgi:hypothetical protein